MATTNEEDIVFVDTTGSSKSSCDKDDDEVVDEKKEEFRRILKSTAMKKNVDNIVESFMDGDTNDYERLVEILEEHRVTPENVNAIFNRWFHIFPKNVGIDVFRPRKNRLKSDELDEVATDPANIVKDVTKREAAALANEINMMEAQKLKLSLKKQLKELDQDENNTKQDVKERIEPVIIMTEDGNVEVAKDEKGVPITRKIVEPISSVGGASSSLTEMMMMQKILGSDNKSNSTDSIATIRIQSLESEIARLKEHNDAEIERYRDRLADKDKEIENIKESYLKEISNIKERYEGKIENIKEDHLKEISNIRERYEDKIDNLESKHADAIAALDDKWQMREDRLLDKMDRIEADAADNINGLQYRHQEEIARLHADYKQQIRNFIEQSKGDLDSVKTVHQLQLMSRDERDALVRQHEAELRALEKKIEENKNMSAEEKQNAKIIEAVTGGVGKAFETLGKPLAANMQTQQMIAQKTLAESMMAQRQAKIDEMRRSGYTEDEIAFVMNGNTDRAHDDAYEQILQEEGLIPDEPKFSIEPEHSQPPLPDELEQQSSPSIVQKPVMVVR